MDFYNFLNASASGDASSFNYLIAGGDIPWPTTCVRLEQQTLTTTQHNNTPNPFMNTPSSSGTQLVDSNDSTPSTIFYTTRGPKTPAHQIIRPCEPPHITSLGEPKKPPSDLYLCRNCYNAVQSFVRRDVNIHLWLNACDICDGTHKTPTTINITTKDPSAYSRRHSATSEPATRDRPSRTRNKTRERRRSMTPHIATKNSTKFHCSVESCNRGINGTGFTRKDNRNVHERAVHGVGVARSPAARV